MPRGDISVWNVRESSIVVNGMYSAPCACFIQSCFHSLKGDSQVNIRAKLYWLSRANT